MKILMLGWEYPPNITGGLGVASQGIAEALAKQAEVTFLLPKKTKEQVSQQVALIDLAALSEKSEVWYKKTKKKETITETSIGQILVPYLPPKLFTKTEKKTKTTIELTEKEEAQLLGKIELTGSYEKNLLGQVSKYAFMANHFAQKKQYDVIHAHDWPTFKAAIAVKKSKKIPLAVHIHSTEFERNGIHAENVTVELEKEGMEAADIIFTVSQRTKELVVSRYGIADNKIKVVPNAIELKASANTSRIPTKIGFIGRFTHQKNPSTFMDLARALKSKGHPFNYTMIGDGYLLDDLKNKAASQNLDIRFTGFLTRQNLLKKLNTFDLLIVPSNAEPFGLVTLEAIMKKIPVAAALGSGVAEFIPSLPQVDKWNHFAYVQLIEKLMTDEEYRERTIENCLAEASQLSWARSAKEILTHYSSS